MEIRDPRFLAQQNEMQNAALEEARYSRRVGLALEVLKIFSPEGHEATVNEAVYDAANAVLLELLGGAPTEPASEE
jgi:hypothetical protein